LFELKKRRKLEMKIQFLIILILLAPVPSFQQKILSPGSKQRFKEIFLGAVNNYKEKIEIKNQKGGFIIFYLKLIL
jgi:hypothetical protein